jgi:hypothetical protein
MAAEFHREHEWDARKEKSRARVRSKIIASCPVWKKILRAAAAQTRSGAATRSTGTAQNCACARHRSTRLRMFSLFVPGDVAMIFFVKFFSPHFKNKISDFFLSKF